MTRTTVGQQIWVGTRSHCGDLNSVLYQICVVIVRFSPPLGGEQLLRPRTYRPDPRAGTTTFRTRSGRATPPTLDLSPEVLDPCTAPSTTSPPPSRSTTSHPPPWNSASTEHSLHRSTSPPRRPHHPVPSPHPAVVPLGRSHPPPPRHPAPSPRRPNLSRTQPNLAVGPPPASRSAQAPQATVAAASRRPRPEVAPPYPAPLSVQPPHLAAGQPNPPHSARVSAQPMAPVPLPRHAASSSHPSGLRLRPPHPINRLPTPSRLAVAPPFSPHLPAVPSRPLHLVLLFPRLPAEIADHPSTPPADPPRPAATPHRSTRSRYLVPPLRPLLSFRAERMTGRVSGIRACSGGTRARCG